MCMPFNVGVGGHNLKLFLFTVSMIYSTSGYFPCLSIIYAVITVHIGVAYNSMNPYCIVLPVCIVEQTEYKGTFCLQ